MAREPDDIPEQLTALQEGAAQLHELFDAYVKSGFTRHEALEIIIRLAIASGTGTTGD